MQTEIKNPYETLNTAKDATPDQIKKAYRDLAKKYHPDKVAQVEGANDLFKEEMQAKMAEISAAYAVLSDPDSKKLYDETGKIETAQTFESLVDGWINKVLTQALQDKDIKSKTIIRNCEKIFRDEINNLKNALEAIGKYRESLTDIHAKKCKKSGSDSEDKQRRKAQFEHILKQTLNHIDKEIEKIREQCKVAEAAFEQLKELMDENDERVERPSFTFAGNPANLWSSSNV